MLLEIAVADALGACFEQTDKWIIINKNKLQYLTLEENPSLIKPVNFTDDLQMSLAISELMLENKEWNHYNIAEKFVKCFHRDPRRGYAPGFYLFLLNHNNAAGLRTIPMGDYAEFQILVEYKPKGCITWDRGGFWYDGWKLRHINIKRDGTLLDGKGKPLPAGADPVFQSWNVYATTDFNKYDFGKFLGEEECDNTTGLQDPTISE